MGTAQIIYIVFVFAVAFTVALVVLYQLTANPARRRLAKVATPVAEKTAEPAWLPVMAKVGGIFAKLSLPKEGWEHSPLRIRFMNAGYRNPNAPVLFFAGKTILAFSLPALMVIYALVFGTTIGTNLFLTLLLVLTFGGYILPNFLLDRRITYRKREIFENFPDAIDLMTVCVEAGLGLDEAIARVGEEMKLKTHALSEELHLVSLELRAGGGRETALKNLALRTGMEEIDMLVATLVQSDRFGTSIGESLRVHSDSLRTKRRLMAEEAAAKVPVKLLFPLIFCIFPALMFVLLGPAFISIYRTLLPTLASVAQR